jgi:hypothetical protein
MMNKQVMALVAVGVFVLVGFILKEMDPFSDRQAPSQPVPLSQVQHVPSEKDEQESKEVAERFLRAYVSYDASDPLKYVEDVRPYVMTDFFQKDASIFPRGRSTVQTQEITTMESFKVDGVTPESIQWNIITIEKITTTDKKSHLQERWYWITLKKDQTGEWKVKEVEVETNGGE